MNLCYLTFQTESIHTVRWLGWFRDAGHRVSCLSPAACVPLEIEGVPYYPLTLPGWGRTRLKTVFDWLDARALRRALARLRPDILHVHWLDNLADVAAASRFHPLVLTAWGSDVMGLAPSQRARPGLVRALEAADAVTGDSRSLCDQMVALGANRDRTHEILWGVDPERFRPGPKSDALGQRLGLNGGAVVLSVRKFRPLFNQPSIVRSIPLVRQRFPRTTFVFLACPEPADAEQGDYPGCKALARELAVGEACRWVEGGLPHREMADALRLADICLTVPDRDATSVSLLEAMASGVPSVASDIPANREWICPGESGLLVPPRDPGALATAICHLLESHEASESMGQHARVAALACATQEANMRAMEQICLNLIA